MKEELLIIIYTAHIGFNSVTSQKFQFSNIVKLRSETSLLYNKKYGNIVSRLMSLFMSDRRSYFLILARTINYFQI